jgi:hypothetical protein
MGQSLAWRLFRSPFNRKQQIRLQSRARLNIQKRGGGCDMIMASRKWLVASSLKILKILLIPLILIQTTSCSSDSDKFNEQNHVQIWLDGIFYETNGNTLYLYDDIYIISGETIEITSIRDLRNYEYLQDFFWVVNSDTTRDYAPKKDVPYGKHFVKLSLIDIWGDTLSYSDSIWVNERFSVSLLSPIDSISSLSAGDIAEFQYKINGVNEGEESHGIVYICLGDRDCDAPMPLRNNYLTLADAPVFWHVKAFKKISETFSLAVSSEVRSVWPKN